MSFQVELNNALILVLAEFKLLTSTSVPRLDASRPDASLSHCSIPDGTLVKFDFRNLRLGSRDASCRIVECVPDHAKKVSTEMVEGTQNGKSSQIKFWRCCQCLLLFGRSGQLTKLCFIGPVEHSTCANVFMSYHVRLGPCVPEEYLHPKCPWHSTAIDFGDAGVAMVKSMKRCPSWVHSGFSKKVASSQSALSTVHPQVWLDCNGPMYPLE